MLAGRGHFKYLLSIKIAKIGGARLNKTDKKKKQESALSILKKLSGYKSQQGEIQGAIKDYQPRSPLIELFPPKVLNDFKKILSSIQNVQSNSQLDETANQLLQNLEKMTALVKKKDRRISELEQYEYSAKKAIEQKTWLQEELDKERMAVKLLEKEKESQLSALMETRQHAQQLERAVQFLQQRNDEILIEKTHLTESLQEAEGLARCLKDALQDSKNNIAELEKRLTTEVEGKQELNHELMALYKQFGNLKLAVENEKQKLSVQIGLKEKIQAEFVEVNKQKEFFRNELVVCQKEIEAIKLHVTKGMREAKELENRYYEAVTEKINSLKAYHQLQREFDKQHQDIVEMKEKLKTLSEREKINLQDAETKISKLMQRNAHVEKEFSCLLAKQNDLVDNYEMILIKNEIVERERENLSIAIKELEIEKENYNQQYIVMHGHLTQSLHENESLKEQNEHLLQEILLKQALMEEKQVQLDEAHQHLAKKVREAAILHDRVEELNSQIEEFNNMHSALQEASSQFDGELQKIEAERKEAKDKIQKYEVALKNWEEKYFYLEKVAQQSTERIAELEKIANYHAQLQTLLTGFGPLPGMQNQESKPLTDGKLQQQNPPLKFGSPISEEVQTEEESIAKEPSKAYPNLFDLPPSHQRPKQTLFD